MLFKLDKFNYKFSAATLYPSPRAKYLLIVRINMLHALPTAAGAFDLFCTYACKLVLVRLTNKLYKWHIPFFLSSHAPLLVCILVHFRCDGRKCKTYIKRRKAHICRVWRHIRTRVVLWKISVNFDLLHWLRVNFSCYNSLHFACVCQWYPRVPVCHAKCHVWRCKEMLRRMHFIRVYRSF